MDFNILETEATKEESKSIKAINKDSVHKICSGQVVLSLAVAVKELVENAIDAGATLIEIKLRDQGLESVEVCDNGSGVEEKNIDSMAAKYHTSKIREFIDLQTVETFGFRGEALSSLCAVADMSITTRHNSANVATRIDLDHEGNIKKRQPCARSVGTTVTLRNLFETLPVRRRDFLRNIKKEFTKMCQILQAYCLVTRGVRIICSNQSAKGVKSVVIQTNGSQDILNNISAVFGNRQIKDILELKSPLRDNNDATVLPNVLLDQLQTDIGDSFHLTKDDIIKFYDTQFKLEGYISSCVHGAGRSSKDRQYFYVNSRPCDPKNISKAVNDCYHRYNANQYPFVYLNIITDRQSVDVNLTPDKRQLLINNEKILLALITKSLIATFENIPSTFKLQNSNINSSLAVNESRHYAKKSAEDDGNSCDVPLSSTQSFSEVFTQWKQTGDTDGKFVAAKTVKRKNEDEIASRTFKLKKIQDFLSREVKMCNSANDKALKSESESKDEIDIGKNKHNTANTDLNANKPTVHAPQRIDCKNVTPFKHKAFLLDEKLENSTDMPNSKLNPVIFEKVIELDESDSESELTNQTCCELQVTLTDLRVITKAEEAITEERKKTKLSRLRFRSEINPNQNKNAETELQKEISKSCFAQMEVLGQFNLGFIIVKLNSDLFIVDQHATDEKYNFETLQNTVQLQHQPLTIPQPLNLTAVNEMILIDNLPIFEKNGFKFDIDNSASPTKKIRLLGKPFSKNWEFGKEDIDELIFMLQDAPEGSLCRPSRIRAMFASRACRMSVMIGKALKKSTMVALIRHMGEIEQPWNCPHGRPTMRHLINIGMLTSDEELEQQSQG